ncbi:hypothetical protein DFQ28_009514 [Apophysomyces sp. BC1034]|nr:hypothetical protein DFQ30_006765 [Apophysomyces sp. BC1015]KAG0176798.1 hypothetical protein DFQ29_005607 [Apophysomyces sp. BC1021]KAG0185333.1 hypothetical protein DFQ28_009514 [Apophysomyces sp. BC1034]
MIASTALIAALLKGKGADTTTDKQTQRSIVEQHIIETKVVVDPDTASTAGSQSTIVDEDSSLQLKSRLIDLFSSEGLLLSANQAIGYVGYALSDLVFLYPGSSSTLGQGLSEWTQEAVRNSRGELVKVLEMETRAGALQAVQGALAQQKDKTATVLTSSEALLPMIPNIHALALTRQPVVFHVAAQSVDEDLVAHSHVDTVLAARNTGALLLSSSTVQESHDIAVIAHLLARAVGLPVIHFFDGAAASKEIQRARLLPYHRLAQLLQGTASGKVDYAEAYGVAIKALAQFGYKPFEYVGAANAETVLVTLEASTASLRSSVERASVNTSVGLLSIRLYRPWSEANFIAALPQTVRRVVVLEEGDGLFAFNSPLYLDIAAAIRFTLERQARPRLVTAQASDFNHLQKGHIPVLVKEAEHETFIDLLAGTFSEHLQEEQDDGVWNAVFWDVEKDGSAKAAANITQLIHQQTPTLPVAARAARDAYRLGGAVVSTRVGTTKHSKAQFIGIHNTTLIKEYDILALAEQKATILVHGPWTHGDEIEAHLTNEFKLALTQLGIKLYAIDGARIAEELGLHQKSSHVVWEAAYLQLTQPSSGSVASRLAGLYEELELGEEKRDLRVFTNELVAAVSKGLVQIELLPTWTILEINDTKLPVQPIDRAAVAADHDDDEDDDETVEAEDDEDKASAETGKWHKAAWHVIFKEAFANESAVRPDLHESTHVVKLTENKRLTPGAYDRNVFHLEFDTTQTSLKYEIGDALGVHGHNDYEEVQSFLDWYGLRPNDVVLVKNNARKEARTVFQLFSQTLDIFGRPSKNFYERLATYATDPKEREQLLYLVSAEGKEEYKKRVDDTVTYEDLLREFSSAKPPLEALVQLVTPIKPRHYSIASSQKLHPNSVHLLVVAVEWTNAAGEQRFGQCTRYLANLTPGVDVTVSIKPSVMKLPPLDTQPVIMAGLGTGMAPFRAFIQERAVAKAAGKEVGPVVLYFGSRNRRNEYLYGEELEAYHAEGLLSHMGLAFSRDQKEKVYIQHKMMEDAELLHDYLINKNGHFYLCGPTWPVPDVKDAVVYGLKNFGGIDEAKASELIEEWKEQEKYVLEVY